MSMADSIITLQSTESSMMKTPLQPLIPSPLTAATTIDSSSPLPIDEPIGNQEEAVELRAVAEDFPNLMRFKSIPAMLDLCITDALMPSNRFMYKMTQDEDIVAPPSSIQFADEMMMQAGSPSLCVGVKQQPLQTVVSSPIPHTPSVAVPITEQSENFLTNSGLNQGAWSKPLTHNLSPPLINSSHLNSQEVGVNRFSALSSEWPDLSRGASKVVNRKSWAKIVQPGVKQMKVPSAFPQEISSFISNDQEYPWAARMKGKCNLHRVTNPSYMEDGTPLVSIPSHILLEGVENQKEYVVGQFYRCLVPSGGQTHAVVNRLWGRKGRIFTRKLGEFSYLFHIPDEQTRDWVLQRGLWHVDDCLMFVSPWSPSETISMPAISTVPVWLTLKNIPNQLYSFKGIDWIASGIGAPMLSSKPWLDPTQMGEAKILVEVKLSKPFPQKVALKDKSGSITMVDVLYSWLPPKCPTCGQLGHKASRCLGMLSVSDPTVQVTTETSNEVPAIATTSLNTIISESVTQLATQIAAQAPIITAPTEPALHSEVITENVVSSETAPLSAEEPALIQTTSVNDGNATTTLHALPAVPMVTHSNSYSVLETHEDISDNSDVLVENEELDKGDTIVTMGIREMPLDTETLQDEEASCPRSRVGRPLKPTQKIQEQWITVGGRGKHGRRGRGGLGHSNS